MVLVINKVLAIFLLIAAGYFVGKIKVLPAGADKTLNILLIQIITPCMILSSITSKDGRHFHCDDSNACRCCFIFRFGRNCGLSVFEIYSSHSARLRSRCLGVFLRFRKHGIYGFSGDSCSFRAGYLLPDCNAQCRTDRLSVFGRSVHD